MVKHVLVTFGAVFLATLLFSTPLIMKYHVNRPHLLHITSGDIMLVNRALSTVWCQGVAITADSPFKSILFENPPPVKKDSFTTSSFIHAMNLQNHYHEYQGFHLLEGSRSQISACVRLSGAAMTVVKSYADLRCCLREHKVRLLKANADLAKEDSLSESESDDETSSISSSQGVVSNETDNIYSCKSALYHVHLPSKYSCGPGSTHSDRSHVLTHDIEESGHYYYIYTSDTYLNIIPNKVSINFTISRTHYDKSLSISNCSGSAHCELPYSLGSEERIVLEMANLNGPLKNHTVVIACKHRKGLHFVFYAAFTIVVFLCAFY